MKKSELRQIIKEEIGKIKENYNEQFLGQYAVYAESSEEGMFQELVILPKASIISDDEETADGTLICKYKDKGSDEELIFFYIDKAE